MALQTIKIPAETVAAVRRIGAEETLRSGHRATFGAIIAAALAVAAAHPDEFSAELTERTKGDN